MHELLKNYTILYVEDEPSIQKNIQEYLEGFFKEVYVASDGKEGLEKYLEHKPQVLLLDIDIPYMDGLTLAKKIRQNDKTVSIIMLTAFTEQEKLLRATELKLLKYLVKPLDLNAFQETLALLAEELCSTFGHKVFLGEGYVWQKDKKQLTYKNDIMDLTAKEQHLLDLLVRHKNTSLSFEDIMAHVWEDEFDREISVNCVKNVVSDLRKKLPAHAIKSIYGKGYMLQV